MIVYKPVAVQSDRNARNARVKRCHRAITTSLIDAHLQDTIDDCDAGLVVIGEIHVVLAWDVVSRVALCGYG